MSTTGTSSPPHLGVELRGEPVEVRRVAEIAAVVFGHGEDGEEVQDVAERREAHVIIISYGATSSALG